LRHAIAQIDPNVPSDDSLETAAASLHGFLGYARFRAALFGGFAVLAVALVAVGLLAVVFRSATQRSREIGIRLALGAKPARVRRDMLVQGLRPAAIGLVAGLIAAATLSRTLSAFLPRVSPTDMAVFASSALLLSVVAVVAMLGPIHRATRIDPGSVLRGE
jgi:ABC-type antimicrobial peptide transport system permease subunit